MTEPKNKTLEKKVDELQQAVTILSTAILELSKTIPDAIIESSLKSTKGMIQICKINEKFNAKLRKIDMSTTKQMFYISSSVALLFLILIVMA